MAHKRRNGIFQNWLYNAPKVLIQTQRDFPAFCFEHTCKEEWIQPDEPEEYKGAIIPILGDSTQNSMPAKFKHDPPWRAGLSLFMKWQKSPVKHELSVGGDTRSTLLHLLCARSSHPWFANWSFSYFWNFVMTSVYCWLGFWLSDQGPPYPLAIITNPLHQLLLPDCTLRSAVNNKLMLMPLQWRKMPSFPPSWLLMVEFVSVICAYEFLSDSIPLRDAMGKWWINLHRLDWKSPDSMGF